jgi:hypothetical protein
LERLQRYEAVELHDLILRMTEADPSNRLSIKLVLKHPLFNWAGDDLHYWDPNSVKSRVDWILRWQKDMDGRDGKGAWLTQLQREYPGSVLKQKLDSWPRGLRTAKPFEDQDRRLFQKSGSEHTDLIACIRHSAEHPDICDRSILKLQALDARTSTGKEELDQATIRDAVGRFFLDQFPRLFVVLFDDVLRRSGADNDDPWVISAIGGARGGQRAAAKRAAPPSAARASKRMREPPRTKKRPRSDIFDSAAGE